MSYFCERILRIKEESKKETERGSHRVVREFVCAFLPMESSLQNQFIRKMKEG